MFVLIGGIVKIENHLLSNKDHWTCAKLLGVKKLILA